MNLSVWKILFLLLVTFRITQSSLGCQVRAEWRPGVICGGHFGSVNDIAWDTNGNYLLSVSSDQTTRLHGPWLQSKDTMIAPSYHELARPQVHGHDMQCITAIDSARFVSGAEEKILRSFGAPMGFAENFLDTTKLFGEFTVKNYCCGDGNATNDENLKMMALGASVPSLGLSNKAVYLSDLTKTKEPSESNSAKADYPHFSYRNRRSSEPPSEGDRKQNTLWPELQKLYGHGYEVYCVACHPNGKLLASACKATKMEYAAVILWSVDSWEQIGQCSAHSLTVTQIKFSPSGQYLLTVSRDRTWALFERGDADADWKKVNQTDKKNGHHSRIIWGCAWTHDSRYFVTVSRDKKAVLWSLEDVSKPDVISSTDNVVLDQAITAVDVAPVFVGDDRNAYLMAFGLETGQLLLYSWDDRLNFQCMATLDSMLAHAGVINKVKFRPILGRCGYQKINDKTLQLASCSIDFAVKLYDIDNVLL